MMASPEATELERDAIRANFGLDKPLWEQYAIFMSHAVRLDFGKSFLTGQSAMGLILERMPATLELAVVSMLLAGLVGVPLGIWAGLAPRCIEHARHHDRLGAGLLAAQLLGRVDADHGVRRVPGLGAGQRARQDGAC
jgi:ABC-type microcin C transport system permease subunit YejB